MKQLDVDELHRRFIYDPETGTIIFRRTLSTKVKVGDVVGYRDKMGYYSTNINKSHYYLHRIAWAMVHNKWPVETIDHIDGDPSNNRISNLRIASHQNNCRNRKCRRDNRSSRYKGVHCCPGNRWRATIGNKPRIHIGYFASEVEAARAYNEAAINLHGEYALLNSI